MKYFIAITALLFNHYIWAQDSLLIHGTPQISQEQQVCYHAKNQLQCLDSLIRVNQNRQTINPKSGNYIKESNQQRRLLVYQLNAGFIYSRRGRLEQGFQRLGEVEKHLDSLKMQEKLDELSQNIGKALPDFRRRMCYEAYLKDTAQFNKCRCAQYFPEWNEEELQTDTTSASAKVKTPEILELKEKQQPMKPHPGFFSGDTLQFKPSFRCDTLGKSYFLKHQQLFLTKLRYAPIPEMAIEMSGNAPDSLILQITIQVEANCINRKVEIVWQKSKTAAFNHHFLNLFTNMELPYTPKSLSFYLPIVLQPEEPDNGNHMSRVALERDHFRVEYECIKPLKLH